MLGAYLIYGASIRLLKQGTNPYSIKKQSNSVKYQTIELMSYFLIQLLYTIISFQTLFDQNIKVTMWGI